MTKTTALARDLWNGLLDLVYPAHCLVCGTAGDDYLCANCIEQIDVIGEQHCIRCAMPCEAPICNDCRNQLYEFESAASAGVYEGVLRKALHALKYDRHLVMVEPLADLMTRCFPRRQFSGKVDVVVPIPIHRCRMVDRGFNQSLELSRRMCERLSLPLEPQVLYKTRRTRHQADLSQDQRVANLRCAFGVSNPNIVAGKQVLLVDDVFTTGSTLNEAALALKNAGAQSVHVYTLSRSV
ncbi:MAG: ComF family protein [Armatimonadota bacterium]|nr:ComF family protein [bacterium]